MKAYYQEHKAMYLTFIFLILVGMYGGPLAYAVFPLAIVLMKQKEMYEELLIGFFLILILSDSLEPRLDFAKDIKTVYISLLVFFVLFDRKQFTPYNQFYKIFIPFFILSVVCIAFSETVGVAAQKTFSYFSMFLVIPCFLTKLYREQGTKILRSVILFVTTILILDMVIAVLDHDAAYNVTFGRFKGVFGNPNGLGLFCFLAFTLFFTINNIYTDLFSRQEKILIYGLIATSIILSGSRNSVISIVLLVLFTYFFKRSLVVGFILSTLFIFVSIALLDDIPYILMQLGLGSYFRLNSSDELSGRSVAWQFAWTKIQENVFIGKGFGFDEYIMRKNSHMLGKLGHQGGVHSSFFSLWLNFGLVGLVVYFRCYFIIFIRAAKINKIAFPVMYAVLFSATFEGLFIGSLNPHMIILLLVVTILLGLEPGYEADPDTETQSIQLVAP
ncbi:MAG: O-antigen ligase family protein [Bacteroidia bacterium]